MTRARGAFRGQNPPARPNIDRVRLPPARMACALASAWLWTSIGAVSRAEAAPLSADLSVERAAGTEDCPDRESLGGLVVRIVNPRGGVSSLGGPGSDVRAVVQFSRAGAGYQATLRLAGAKEGERTLTDTAATCTALGRAVAITMALLLDAGLEAAPEAAPPAPAAVAVAPAAPVEAPPRATSAFLAVTAGPALGLVGPPSLATGLAFELRLGRRISVELEGQYVAPRATAFDTGQVDVALLAGRTRLCGAVAADAPVRVALCAEGGAGQLRGQGRGFATANGAAGTAWLGAGGGLQASGVVGRRWILGVSADVLAPLHKSTFSIENRGIAYRSSAVAGLLAVGVGVKLW
jgi:hypothetical protein